LLKIYRHFLDLFHAIAFLRNKIQCNENELNKEFFQEISY